jgi:hypothetical protein
MRLEEPDAAESALQDFTEAIRLAADEPHLYILGNLIGRLVQHFAEDLALLGDDVAP